MRSAPVQEKRRRRLPRLTAALLLFVVLLEVVLQIGALVTSLALRPSAAPSMAPHVLCVGDSFTFGIGASSPQENYPSALASILTERGAQVEVQNVGRPGQNSRDALVRLAGRITPNTKAVCVLLGANDSWSHPPLITAEELEAAELSPTEGFTWRWRTGRLLALAFRFSFGSWQASGNDASNTAATTAADGGNEDDTAAVAAGRVAGFGLLLRYGRERSWVTDALPDAFDLPRDPALADSAASFWQPVLEKRDLAALEVARTLATDHPDSPQALALLVMIEQRTGNPTADTLARLERLATECPSAAAAEWRLWALAEAGHSEAAIAAAEARISIEPRSVVAWEVLQKQTFERGEWARFREAAAQTLMLLNSQSPEKSALILRRLADATTDATGQQIAQLLIAAQLLDGLDGKTRSAIAQARSRGRIATDDLETLLGDPSIPEAVRPRLRAVLAERDGNEREQDWYRVLHDHIVMIGQLAARSGARVVVLSYPYYHAELEQAQRDAAATLGGRFAAVRSRFDAELRSREREELFVPDGHCSDAGYRLVAEVTAEQVLAALVR
ncbi:MAG: hypothetical protein KDC98_11245 [Planctomycetes bacterium]|nr:hypothetical protein [Planctomycetota bacterium]